MTYRIAVVGIGKIARDQHLPCIAKNKKFELVAAVSRHGKVDGVANFESIAALKASKLKVDCVALCTPPAVRLAMARECLDAGWHLLIEKPPTPTVGELLAMEAHAKKKKRVLYATWHSRYNASVDEAKKLLKGKHVDFLRVTWKEDVNKWHPGQAWIWQPGGFGVFDPGINALSIVTKILPEAIFVEGATIEVPSNAATPIGADITATVRFPTVTPIGLTPSLLSPLQPTPLQFVPINRPPTNIPSATPYLVPIIPTDTLAPTLTLIPSSTPAPTSLPLPSFTPPPTFTPIPTNTDVPVVVPPTDTPLPFDDPTLEPTVGT